MKLLTGCMLAVGLLLPMLVLAHPPRPEEAVAKLDLSPSVREQVLETFATAKARHESLRKSADAQRSANDTAFCAIRSETQAALAKLLSQEQLDTLNAAMRPPRDSEGNGPRGAGPRDGMGGPRDGMRGGPGAHRREPMAGAQGQHRPPPMPRCEDGATQQPAGA